MKNHVSRNKRVVFVCAANLCRSPTGEALLKLEKGYEAKSAGICKGAIVELDRALVEWADLIFVMEDWMRDELVHNFGNHWKVKVLDIPDQYAYGDFRLVRMLQRRLKNFGITFTFMGRRGEIPLWLEDYLNGKLSFSPIEDERPISAVNAITRVGSLEDRVLELEE